MLAHFCRTAQRYNPEKRIHHNTANMAVVKNVRVDMSLSYLLQGPG
jgi:RNase P/RNase MRP subunit p30